MVKGIRKDKICPLSTSPVETFAVLAPIVVVKEH